MPTGGKNTFEGNYDIRAESADNDVLKLQHFVNFGWVIAESGSDAAPDIMN